MIDIEQTLSDRFPDFFQRQPRLISKSLIGLLRRLFKEGEINAFLADRRGVEGVDFIEHVLDYFDFSYRVSSKERENIPASGRVVIIANHPLGALDALALIRLINEVRPDVKVVANGILSQLAPLKPLLLPVDNLTGATTKSDIKRINDALMAEQAVIVFPAGEVSRVRPSGIRDGNWRDGFLRMAARAEAPLLPVYIEARNSSLFYGVSMVYKPLAALLLVQEMFRQRSNTIGFRVGELIPYVGINLPGLKRKARVRLIKRHFYKVAKGRKGLFETETAIAHPESRQALKSELKQAQRLGATRDGKAIFLVDYRPDSALMDEVGRLREVTFRKVGEGTGRRRDVDYYDQYYRHLVLWDEETLELVGAYRIGEAENIVAAHGVQGLYTHSLFHFKPDFEGATRGALELGRSFVQPGYWGSRALDYLWQGLGAYLRHNPQIRRMFGPVSISRQYPPAARDLIVAYYDKHYGAKTSLMEAKNPVIFADGARDECRQLLSGNSAEEDFVRMREYLDQFGLAVPTLYKQYTDVCEPGGVEFHAFSIDADFGNCVDGFIMVDLERLKPRKRQRYIGE